MHLDPHGEDEEGKEGYIEEQRVVHTHHPSTDSLEDVPGNRAEFRGQGGGKNLRRRGVKGSSDDADAKDVEEGGRGERTFSFNN